MRHDSDRTNDRRLTVLEASALLGITPDAVRARLRRGTLRKERAEDGTLLVVLDGSVGDTTATDRPTEQPTVLYINALKSQIEMLQSELEARKEEARRKDTILLNMTEAMKSLEAPRESPLSAEGQESNGETPPEQERRPWWRLALGLK